MTVVGPLIWIVDSEQWPRAALRAELLERGYEVVGFVLLGEALAHLRVASTPTKPRVIVLELRGQDANRESFLELAQLSIPMILLGGSMELNEPYIREIKPALVLKRPISLGEIADSIEVIVPSP